jgi:hypothetical protein
MTGPHKNAKAATARIIRILKMLSNSVTGHLLQWAGECTLFDRCSEEEVLLFALPHREPKEDGDRDATDGSICPDGEYG